MAMFKPKNTHRFTTGAIPKAKSAGQNPHNGITFDYYLPKEWQDTSLLTLEVLDGKGSVVRTLDNQKPEDFKSWEGGPSPPPVLPSAPGLNRFAWDLRRTTLPPVENVFVMGDYRGHLSPPGEYTLRLISRKDTLATLIKILPDPRIKAKEQDFRDQQRMLLQIEATVNDVHKSVNQFRSVTKQLNNRLTLLREMKGKEDLVKIGETALENITNWEEHLIQPKQETFQDVINFRNQLNAELFQLRGMIDSHIPKPTQGTQLRLDELLKMWENRKAEMEEIIEKEIGGFNQAYQSRNVPALIIPKE